MHRHLKLIMVRLHPVVPIVAITSIRLRTDDFQQATIIHIHSLRAEEPATSVTSRGHLRLA